MLKRLFVLPGFILVLMGLVILSMQEPTAATADSPDEEERFVVRAYFDQWQMVNELAVWKEPWEVNEAQQYLIVDVNQREYEWLRNSGFRVEVDAAQTAVINQVRQPEPGQGGGIPGYSCYRTVEETFATAQQLTQDYPDLATWSDIGDSWDKVTPGGPAGYDMMVLRLTNQNIPGPKPDLLLFGAIHAREYTTAETATRFAEHLLTHYDSDADVTWLLDYHEIHFVLQTNPDGRKLAEAGNLWRKNTNDSDGCSTSYGVDLNRNFQFWWNTGGSSSNACSETFHGSEAASEPETQAVQAYGFNIFPDQRDAPISAPAPITTTGIFIDLHSYGREILWPWGFTTNPTPNHTGLQTLARKMGYFGGYDATQSLYTTSGSTKDFFYGEMGLPGYTIEMGTSFFQSCSYFESTIVPEMMETLLYAAKAVRYSYIIPSAPDALNVTLSTDTVAVGDPVNVTATINDTRYNNSQGTEPTQDVAAAEYYIDVPPWIMETVPVAWPMTAVDGTFNNPVEAVTAVIDTAGLTDGRHTIFVRGQDANGGWGAMSAAFLTVTTQLPVAGFTHDSPIAVQQPVTFTNTSTGSNLTYQWDFGDGSGSTEAHPSHSYTEAMTYTVTLTATNTAGSDVSSSVVVVMVPAAAVFTHLPLAATQDTITFTNQSTGTDLTYRWSLGDGSSSTQVHPTHVYAEAMTYTVTLTATNEVSQDIYRSVIAILEPPTAVFSSSPVVRVGQVVSFTNTSTGSQLSYQWDFGDGSGSTAAYPSHVYTTTGVYTVMLTAVNGVGQDAATRPISVQVAVYIPFIRLD